MHKNNPLPLTLACALAAVGAGCAPKAPPAPPPATVMVATPLPMRMVDWDNYDGQFTAVDSVDVRPRVSGYLLRVDFKDGDLVRKGQVLFEIDPRPYQASLDQAKGAEAHAAASLINARQQLERGKTLLAAKAISQQAYETLDAAGRQAAADLQSAQATVKAQALNVGFTKVVAPLAGRVSDRRVAPGNLVAADTTVLTNIASIDPIWFQFTGSEALFLKTRHAAQAATRAATPVEIQLQDESGYRWRGRLDFVDNQIDAGSGAIRQRAVVENPSHFLTPGMFGHARVAGSAPYDALMVPDTAVGTDLNQRVVLVAGPDGTAHERPVSVGPLWRGLRVIRGGVGPSDLIIVDGLQRARAGAKIHAQRTALTPPPQPPPSESQGFSEPVPSAASPADEVFAGR
ncbi:MAG TPA: efflux RND transporter periplasmic adaptor subunit [Caulobacteraceae bacterium]|jgi:RND family efflux transporter MFP subunit|nr:efflux RND transporter periplasmic adaptor subunit [Caulobacteraceae bacterium]